MLIAVPVIVFLVKRYGFGGASQLLNMFEIYQYMIAYKSYKYIFFSVFIILNYTILPYVLYTQLLLICISFVYNVTAIILSDENGHKPLKNNSSPWLYPITFWINSAFFLIYKLKQSKNINIYKQAFYAITVQKLIGYPIIILNSIHVISKCIFLAHRNTEWKMKHKIVWIPIYLYAVYKFLLKELTELSKNQNNETTGMRIYNNFKINGFMDHAIGKIARIMLEKNLLLNNTRISSNIEYEVKKITEPDNNSIHWGVAPKVVDDKAYNLIFFQTHCAPQIWRDVGFDALVKNKHNSTYNLLAFSTWQRIEDESPSKNFVFQNYKDGNSSLYVTERLREIPSLYNSSSKLLLKTENSNVLINKTELNALTITQLAKATLLGVNTNIFKLVDNVVNELKLKYPEENHVSVEELIVKLQLFTPQELEIIALQYWDGSQDLHL